MMPCAVLSALLLSDVLAIHEEQNLSASPSSSQQSFDDLRRDVIERIKDIGHNESGGLHAKTKEAVNLIEELTQQNPPPSDDDVLNLISDVFKEIKDNKRIEQHDRGEILDALFGRSNVNIVLLILGVENQPYFAITFGPDIISRIAKEYISIVSFWIGDLMNHRKRGFQEQTLREMTQKTLNRPSEKIKQVKAWNKEQKSTPQETEKAYQERKIAAEALFSDQDVLIAGEVLMKGYTKIEEFTQEMLKRDWDTPKAQAVWKFGLLLD
eukprot:g8552.t1